MYKVAEVLADLSSELYLPLPYTKTAPSEVNIPHSEIK
jgi:hypothetical protein